MATLFLALIYTTFISLGLPDVLLGAAWPLMQAELAVPLGYAGGVSMLISGCTVLSSLSSSLFQRRFGTGAVVAVSTLLTALALLGFSLSRGYAALLLLAMPLGFGAGAIDTCVNDYVAAHYRAFHMNLLHACWGVGAMLGPLILSHTIAAGSWRAGYRTIGLMQSALAAVLLCAIPAWRAMAARTSPGGVSDEKAPVSSIAATLRVRGVGGAMLCFLCYCAAELSLGLWGASYLTQLRAMAADAAARIVSLYYGGIMAGRVISSFLSLRLGPRTLLRIGQGTALLGALLILLPGPLAAAGFPLFGLGLAPLFPMMLHLTPERFGAAFARRAMSLQMACSYVGSTLMPPLLGAVAGVTGIGILPYALALFIGGMLLFSRLADASLRAQKTAA